MFKPTLIVAGLFCYFTVAYSFVLAALNGQSGLFV